LKFAKLPVYFAAGAGDKSADISNPRYADTSPRDV
jgi:hypothetical protein